MQASNAASLSAIVTCSQGETNGDFNKIRKQFSATKSQLKKNRKITKKVSESQWSLKDTYETVAPTLARLPVGDHHCLFNVAELFEELSQSFIRSMIRQSADEDLGERGVLLSN